MRASKKKTNSFENNTLRIVKSVITLSFLSLGLLVLLSCRNDKKSGEKEGIKKEKDDTIEILSENMDFQTVDTIDAGWHTFRYINKSNDTHFFLLDKYPEGKSVRDTEKEVIPVFQNGMNLITEGKPEEGFSEFNKLPGWFFEIVFSGGSGLLSPGLTSETTLKVEPGYYVIECYVKMENGVFHSAMGMVQELIVRDKVVDKHKLNPNIKITVSSEEGIVYNESIKKGKQTFEVYFKDQIVHENFVGHDVNLVKLSERADLEALEKWMNWADPLGLISPAPQGITFLGGVNDMPAGSSAYFTSDLEPGKYAMISEVPNALNKKMLKTFIVSE